MSRDKELEAILVISSGLLVFHWLFHVEELVYIALGLMIVSLASKYLSSKIVWLWFKLAEVLGFVMSKVLLSLVFFLFLYPISLLFRIFNKDSLGLSKEGKTTYFIERDHQYSAKDLENPW